MSQKGNGPPGSPREVLRGFFVLEGIDGSGTTTQLKQLEFKAKTEKLPLRTDCEPTPHPIGVLIRSILRHEVEADPAVLGPLFAADRRQHLDGFGGIRQALASGFLVVSDRYFFSSLAYQSLDRPWDEVWTLNASFPLPEALFWLDVPVSEAQARIDRRGQGREKFEDAISQEKIRLAYRRAIAQAQVQGLELIQLDGRLPIKVLTDSIWKRICR
jgi:dTMP kinase